MSKASFLNEMLNNLLKKKTLFKSFKNSADINADTLFNNTAPTSSVFSLDDDSSVNSNGGSFVAYCWGEVPGYSKFGIFGGTGVSGTNINLIKDVKIFSLDIEVNIFLEGNFYKIIRHISLNYESKNKLMRYFSDNFINKLLNNLIEIISIRFDRKLIKKFLKSINLDK